MATKVAVTGGSAWDGNPGSTLHPVVASNARIPVANRMTRPSIGEAVSEFTGTATPAVRTITHDWAMGKKLRSRQAAAIYRQTDSRKRDKPPLIIKGVYFDPEIAEAKVTRLNQMRRERGEGESYLLQVCRVYGD
jgi:hypothetical protein